MERFDDSDRSVEELRREKPSALIGAIETIRSKGNLDGDTLMNLAEGIGRNSDVNLFRVMKENPRVTEDVLGTHPDELDLEPFIRKIDQVIRSNP